MYHPLSKQKAFTLVELLIVIGILAILGTAAVIVINPAELMKQTRDATRVADLQTLNKALALYEAEGNTSFGTANMVYLSLPDSNANCSSYTLPTLPGGWTYACKPAASYRNTDSSGWLPVNLGAISSGSPLPTLPVDPVNDATTGEYYAYIAGSWVLTAQMESEKQATTVAQTDGGIDSARLEVGTHLSKWAEAQGLIGYWSFDEGSGSVATDTSGYGNNGTLQGGPTWVTGKIGKALQFDGVDDYIDCGAGTSLHLDGNSFTIAAWIKLDQISRNNNFVGKGGTEAANQLLHFGIRSSNNWMFAFYSNDLNVQGAPAVGTWYHLVGTYDATTNNKKLYLNGSLIGQNTPSSDLLNTDSYPLLIGARNASDHYYTKGLIDEVRLYDRVLTAAEISAAYNATK